jgi:isocitrate dehydrogenase kinase/phosphatase
MCDEEPEWLVKIQQEKKKRIQEYDRKINNIINEMAKLMKEKEIFEKKMEQYITKLMEQWIVGKK